MQVFEVVVTSNPTKEQVEKGVRPEILVPVTAVMAKDSMTAALTAIQQSGKTLDLNDVEVLVRSFR